MVSRFMNTPGIKFCRYRGRFRRCAKALKISKMALQSTMLMIFSNVIDPFGLAFSAIKSTFKLSIPYNFLFNPFFH